MPTTSNSRHHTTRTTKRMRSTQSHVVHESDGLSPSPTPTKANTSHSRHTKATHEVKKKRGIVKTNAAHLLGASSSFHDTTTTTTNDTTMASLSDTLISGEKNVLGPKLVLGATPETRLTVATHTTTADILESATGDAVKESEESEVWINAAMINEEEEEQVLGMSAMKTPQNNHSTQNQHQRVHDPLLQEEKMHAGPHTPTPHNTIKSNDEKEGSEVKGKRMRSVEARLSTSSHCSGRRSDSTWLARLPATVTKSQLAQGEHTSSSLSPQNTTTTTTSNMNAEKVVVTNATTPAEGQASNNTIVEGSSSKARRIVMSHDATVQAILHEEPPTTTRPVELRPGCALPSPRTPLFQSLNEEASEEEEDVNDESSAARRNGRNERDTLEEGYDLFDEPEDDGEGRLRLLGATPSTTTTTTRHHTIQNLPAGRSMNLLDEDDLNDTHINNDNDDEDSEEREDIGESVTLRRNHTYHHNEVNNNARRTAAGVALHDSDTPSPHVTQSQNGVIHESEPTIENTTTNMDFSLTQEAMKQSDFIAVSAAPLQRRQRPQQQQISYTSDNTTTRNVSATSKAAKLLSSTAQVIRTGSQRLNEIRNNDETPAGLTGTSESDTSYTNQRDALRTPSRAQTDTHTTPRDSAQTSNSESASQAARHEALLWARKTRQFFALIDQRPLKAVSPGVKTKPNTLTGKTSARPPVPSPRAPSSTTTTTTNNNNNKSMPRVVESVRVQPVKSEPLTGAATSFAAMVSRVKDEARRQQAQREQRSNV